MILNLKSENCRSCQKYLKDPSQEGNKLTKTLKIINHFKIRTSDIVKETVQNKITCKDNKIIY